MGDKYAIKKKLDLWTGDDKLFIEKQVSAADVGAGIGTMIGFFINAHGANPACPSKRAAVLLHFY